MDRKEILDKFEALARKIKESDLDEIRKSQLTCDVREIESAVLGFGMPLALEEENPEDSELEKTTDPQGKPRGNPQAQKKNLNPLPPSLTRAKVVALSHEEFVAAQDSFPGWLSAKEAYPFRKGDSSRKAFWAWVQCSCEEEGPKIVAHIQFMRRSQRWQKDGGEYIPGMGAYLRAHPWEDWEPEVAPQPGLAHKAIVRAFTPEDRDRKRSAFAKIRESLEPKEMTEAELNDRRNVLAEQARQMGVK